MSELPEPLTPADCDLRDFAFMPLDVLRLRDSDLAAVADAEVFRAAVLSWCVAWHQVPAASLPNDDASLCRLLGYGRDMKGWLRLRAAGALRGYVLCADGRLYHTVVAEKARGSWQKKMEQRARTAAAREARLRQKQSASVTEPPTPLSQTPAPSVTDTVTGSKGEGEGEGEGEKKERTSLRSVTPQRPSAPRGCRLPADWQPSPEDHDFARSLALNPRAVAEQFRDFWHAKAGKDAAKLDWPATWRGWCRREAESRGKSGSQPAKTSRFGFLADAMFGPEGDPSPIIDIAAERVA